MKVEILMNISTDKIISEKVFENFVVNLEKDNPDANIKLKRLDYVAFSDKPINKDEFLKKMKSEQPKEDKQEIKIQEAKKETPKDDKTEVDVEFYDSEKNKTFNFIVALNCLKKGLLVNRQSWGIKTFLKLSDKLKPNGEANIEIGPENGKFSLWYASQEDMAAEDWRIISPFPVMHKAVGVDPLAND